MAFDFSNIKAKGKLNGLSFYSSVSDNDSVHEIPLDLIDSFEGHPFSVVDNDDMIQLTESVKHNGIMNPAIVRRYIRLTYLIKEIRDMVDDDKLSIRAAVEISYIEPAKQAILVPFMQKYDVTINKAAELREWLDNGGLTDNETVTSLFTDKSAKKESSHKLPNAIKYKQIKSYIPDSVLKEDYQSYVIKALLFYRDNGEDV